MYFPPEVDFLHSWANFQADRLYKSNDTYQYKCGGVKAYKKGRGLASGCCPFRFANYSKPFFISCPVFVRVR